VDSAAVVAEGAAALACASSVVLLAAEAIPIVGEAAAIARIATCIICDTLPWIDYAQQMFYTLIMPIQQGIVDVTPFLAFGYANANAEGAGADPLFASVADYTGSLMSDFGLSLPTDSGGIGGVLGGALGSIPIYAAPLDPTALSLDVATNQNNGSVPLNMPEWVGDAGNIAGEAGCSDYGYPESLDGAESAGFDDNWGWNDNFYAGNPGYMTWIAGKTNCPEILGLGNLRWLNGGQQSADQISQVMYTGSIFNGGGELSSPPLSIPGFLAIASSQVEGTPVICSQSFDPIPSTSSPDTVDARGKIIKVYLPYNQTNVDLTTYFIFH
jgi:hypothetical protein